MRVIVNLFWFSFFVRAGMGAVLFRDDLKTATFLAAGSSLFFCSLALLYVIFQPDLRRAYSKAALPLALYLCWQLISIAWTKASIVSALGYWTLNLSDLVFVWASAKALDEQEHLIAALSGLTYSSLAMVFVGLGFHAGSLSSREDLLLQPNFLGNMYSVGLISSAYLAKSLRQGRWFALSGILAIALVLSLSKTSIFAVAVSLVIMFWKQLSAIRHKTAYAVVILAVVAATAAAVHVSIEPEPSDFLTGRPALWVSLIPVIANHPVLGNGFASFKDIAPDVWEGYVPNHAHNEVIHQIATLGVIGLFLAILVYRASFFSRWRVTMTFIVYFLIRGVTEADPYQTIFPLAMILLLTISPTETQSSPMQLPMESRFPLSDS